jgi:23S rRNA pseudouridine1911/1915/1917 synthase
MLFAKPPPKSSFNLEAIEAFEERLDRAEKIGEGIDDEDDEDNDLLLADSENVLSFFITEELHDKRIDAVIATVQPQLSRTLCANMIQEGLVRVQEAVTDDDDQHHDDDNANANANPQHAVFATTVTRKSFKVQQGQTLLLPATTSPSSSWQQTAKSLKIIPQDLPLEVLFEDEHMIVINKAVNVVVHPSIGHQNGTICNALAYYLSHSSPYGPGEFVKNLNNDKNDNESKEEKEKDNDNEDDDEASLIRPGIVHRIDKGTTGVLVVAKTRQALSTLSQAFHDRRVKKTYLAVTVGNPGTGVKIDKPIGRHPVFRQRMRVVPDPHRSSSSSSSQRLSPYSSSTKAQSPSGKSRNAVSFVDTLLFNGKLAFVKVRIVTGRTHQVRVHLQDRKTPIYGDSVYGLSDWNKKLFKSHQLLDRPLLHAYQLELAHPVTGATMVFEAPLPPDMERILKTIDEGYAQSLVDNAATSVVVESSSAAAAAAAGEETF